MTIQNSTFEVGPFHLYRCGSGHLDITLKAFPNANWGWEYGPNEDLEALLMIRVKGLNVLVLDFWRCGFDIRFMGFWWIMSCR